MNSKTKPTNLPKVKVDEDNLTPDVLRNYKSRLRWLRKGLEFGQAKNIPRVVEAYSKYLKCIADYYQVEEPKIRPHFYDQETELAEILLLSHVYWELAKAYDRSPNLHNESVRCLDQFIRFSIGYKFQYINARMLRNYVKKKKAHNLRGFKAAYEKVKLESKDCFIATLYFKDEPETLSQFYKFKDFLVTIRLHKLISIYYSIGPSLIRPYNRNKFVKYLMDYTVYPFLKILSIILRQFK